MNRIALEPSPESSRRDGAIEPGARSSSAPLLSASLPRRFGRYTLFEPIGRGGMAELFLARTENDLGATRLAVVKLILPAFAQDPKFADMLIHEAKLAARLSHRHIVQVLDLGRNAPSDVSLPEDDSSNRQVETASPERLYIAMEYIEGFDLNALLRRCTDLHIGLPAEHALGIVADVLEGLDYAHRRTNDAGAPLSLVHRDVSPSNVLISYDGEVKLCDFGIAHANDVISDDKNEALKGKAGYMSPEHARAESLDSRADVFAAGIILWELLAGRRLYKPRGPIPLLEQARRADIPEIPDKDLPNHDELARIVSRALARNREERYASASAFQRDLESYLAGAGLLASRLKLGEWIGKTFGTSVIDKRRASERRLPKSSSPPPRSSGAVQLRTSTAPPITVPPAPRLPADLVLSVAAAEDRSKAAPATLEGLTMDRGGSSSSPEAGPEKEPSPAALAKKAEDEELLSWARKRGWISFLFFFLIAAVVAVVWFLSR